MCTSPQRYAEWLLRAAKAVSSLLEVWHVEKKSPMALQIAENVAYVQNKY